MLCNYIYIYLSSPQAENLHLSIDRGISFEDITTVIERCGLKKLTLVYESEFTPLRKKHRAILKLAKRHSIEVESAILYSELVLYSLQFICCCFYFMTVCCYGHLLQGIAHLVTSIQDSTFGS